MSDKIQIRGFIAEALGTFILVFGIGISSGLPLVVGGSLWLAMCVTGFKSGAQFNPAVSISIIVKKALERTLDVNTFVTLLINISVQLCGALLAGFLAWGIGRKTFYFDLSTGIDASQAFLCECLLTMLLCMNAHMAGKSKNGLLMEGAIIAITLSTCAYSIGHITRNCLNPAVELGLSTASYANDVDKYSKFWIYFVGPIVGGTLAAGISYFREKQNKKVLRSSLNFELLVK